MIYVLNHKGHPLMPTSRHGKVKHLLREGKAIVVNRTPFTIKLTYSSTNYTQEITLGIDAGSKAVGLSATTKKQELYCSEVQLRTDIVKLLATRRALRSSRRNRKTRYRKPRFSNRKASKQSGWLAPSIRHKVDSHLRLVADIHKILPVTKIIVEVASFDIQKIRNPNIQGTDYQQGEQLDFWNVREYVFWRDNHTCQHCKGKSKDKILEVHHIESRQTGGDAPNNLITLCNTCHEAYHLGEIVLNAKRGESYRDAAFMGIMRWTLYNQLKELYPNVSLTYGYITKNTRITNNLEKSHIIDAYCITGNLEAKRTNQWFLQRFVRRNNRQLHKCTITKGGIRKNNKAPYLVRGFTLFSKVRYNNQDCFVFGRRTSGNFDIRKLDSTVVSRGKHVKYLRLLQQGKTLLTERKNMVPLYI